MSMSSDIRSDAVRAPVRAGSSPATSRQSGRRCPRCSWRRASSTSKWAHCLPQVWRTCKAWQRRTQRRDRVEVNFGLSRVFQHMARDLLSPTYLKEWIGTPAISIAGKVEPLEAPSWSFWSCRRRQHSLTLDIRTLGYQLRSSTTIWHSNSP